MTGTGFESPAVQHIRVAELDLAYREFGEGDPAVLIHGLGGMSTNWTDLMHALPFRLHSAAVDLPGFGSSDPLYRAPSITVFAQIVGDFIEAKFPGRAVHLFGNSLGGAVVVELAAMRPELVRGITLISPALPEYLPVGASTLVYVEGRIISSDPELNAAMTRAGVRFFTQWERMVTR